MPVLVAMFDLGVALTVVVSAVAVVYLGYRVMHGICVYFRYRGSRFVTCPETLQAAVVEVAAGSMGMQAILGEPCFRLSRCSRWPLREGCGQDCLSQIEAHPSELRISAAWRAS